MNLQKTLFFIGLILEINKTLGQINKADIGFEGGAGAVYLRGSEKFNENQDPIIGFTGAFVFRYNFKRIISLHTGISGESKGTSTNLIITDQNGMPLSELNLKTNLYYVTLPVLIRASFGKKMAIFLNGGAYVGYLIKQPSAETLQINLGNNSPLKQFDYGMTTGLGFSVPIKFKAAFSVEFRYNLGLHDINNTQGSYAEPIKTNSANLLLSYTRKFGFRNSSTQ